MKLQSKVGQNQVRQSLNAISIDKSYNIQKQIDLPEKGKISIKMSKSPGHSNCISLP